MSEGLLPGCQMFGAPRLVLLPNALALSTAEESLLVLCIAEESLPQLGHT